MIESDKIWQCKRHTGPGMEIKYCKASNLNYAPRIKLREIHGVN